MAVVVVVVCLAEESAYLVAVVVVVLCLAGELLWTFPFALSAPISNVSWIANIRTA